VQSTNEDWARGYARQALSDLEAREALIADPRARAKKCHRLHFLQMAAEKACKAHLIKTSGRDNVRKSHAYVAKTLPTIARNFYAAMNDSNEIARWELSKIRHLAREIEVLAPACDHGDVRMDNSEYPWQGPKGEVCIPCEYSFPNIDDFEDKTLTRLIKLIRKACDEYANSMAPV